MDMKPLQGMVDVLCRGYIEANETKATDRMEELSKVGGSLISVAMRYLLASALSSKGKNVLSIPDSQLEEVFKTCKTSVFEKIWELAESAK